MYNFYTRHLGYGTRLQNKITKWTPCRRRKLVLLIIVNDDYKNYLSIISIPIYANVHIYPKRSLHE